MTTVMILDDDVLYAELLERFISPLDLETVVIHNSLDALGAFREYTPDVVISDIEMPCKNGLEVLEDLKKEAKQFLTILVSGDPDPYMDEALALGNTEILNKDQIGRCTINDIITRYLSRF